MKYIKTILTIAAIGLLAACSKDSSDEDMAQWTDASIKMMRATRPLLGVESYGDIRVLLAVTGSDAVSEGLFKYMGGSAWTTQLKLKSGEQVYRLYGLMPDNASFTKSLSDWDDDGATLHIQHLPAFTDQDYCVVSGLRQAENETDDAMAIRGNFAFTYNSQRENYINLLFDHLYSRVVFSMKVDAEYDKLRTLKVKSVRIETTAVSRVSADITLTSGVGVNGATYSVTETDNAAKDIFNTEITLTTTTTAVGSVMLIPYSAMFSNLRLVTEYDVYDKQGAKIAERTAVNKLAVPLADLQSGEERTLLVTVDPSYLYVLSDNDPPFVVVRE